MKTYTFLSPKRLKGFTLTEILIALVILGILSLIILPNVKPLINKAKATEAKLQLVHLRTLEQDYFYEHSQYSKELSDIGFIQEKLSTDGPTGHANYRIEVVSVTNTTFTGRATAVKDFDGDGKYDTWEIDQDGNLKHVNQN
jgi:type IV pilus assembly protein PilE